MKQVQRSGEFVGEGAKPGAGVGGNNHLFAMGKIQRIVRDHHSPFWVLRFWGCSS